MSARLAWGTLLVLLVGTIAEPGGTARRVGAQAATAAAVASPASRLPALGANATLSEASSYVCAN